MDTDGPHRPARAAGRWGRACGAALAILVAPATATGETPPMAIDERCPDREFFSTCLDWGIPGLAPVRAAAEADDFQGARRALAEYYRSRRIATRFGDPEDLGMTAGERAEFAEWGRRMLARELLEGYWTGPYEIDWWHDPAADRFARMYWWDALAKAYVARDFDPEIARLWVGLLRSFVDRCPPPADGRPNLYWEGLTGGIRLRGGWPLTFHAMARSEAVTDDDILVFLKSLVEQGEFIRRTHWPVGNKIAFAMVGLYSSGVMFPELSTSRTWTDYAVATALGDLSRGYFPDGMGVELSPGYHNAFTNYLTMVEIARGAGRDTDPRMRELATGCERLFPIYAKLAAPDGTLPRYQDGGAVDVGERFRYARSYFPENALFRWFATDGREGEAPGFRSLALPYAGYVAMRTGWGGDANYVGFDAGPVGLGHAHQDKLNLVLWSYGRMLLMDPGHGDYRAGEFSRWALDTFAHNTALVDNRPQRRKWGKSGGFMPTEPLTDLTFETGPDWDYAAGVYDGAYGLPGPSDSYPYGEGSTFKEGWGRPAVHHRRVFFRHPDIVLVSDTLVPGDDRSHDYEIRWHLDSTEVRVDGDSGVAATRDPGKPNLLIVPAEPAGLSVTTASAQTDPVILGWNFHDKTPRPATTVRHAGSGAGTVRFLTLLLPVRADASPAPDRTVRTGDETFRLDLPDGRRYDLIVPNDPERRLSVSAAGRDGG